MHKLKEFAIFKILDKSKNLNTFDFYKLYVDSFSWSRDHLISYQNEKLKKLIKHSYDNIPFYNQCFKQYGLTPTDINTIEDINKLPILTREDIKNNYKTIIDNNNKYSKIFLSSSSGTTGTPLQFIHDRNSESAGIASKYALYSLSGYHLGDKILHVWGNPASIKKWATYQSKFKQKIINQINYPSFLLNDNKNYKKLLELILKTKPKYIDGYSSAIGSFASWLEKYDIQIPEIKTIFTTAENLTINNKLLINKRIGPISDLYGSSEINGIAIQPRHDKLYYFLESRLIIEIVNNNGLSEVIITDLENMIMPFIRYKIGDTIDGVENTILGSKLPFKSFNSLDGRISNYIKLNNGKIIHPINLLVGTFLRKFPSITRHKVIWDGAVLEFIIEVSEVIDMEELKRAIKANIIEYELDYKITLSDKIYPNSNGKFSYLEIKN